MTHPNSLDLEAFACGEPVASVSSHLPECTVCSAFVERLRGALSAGPSRATAAAVVAKAAPAAAPRASASIAVRKSAWWLRASTVAVPLAAAAALLLFLKSPSGTRDPGTPAISEPTSPAPPVNTADPETTFKGGLQIAVIRERAGIQTRFTGAVPVQVRPGDRLRVEVALDREQAILAAVLGDDASWLELMPESVRRPGTHFSEKSARVDSSPLRGTILVGSPEAVLRARTTKRLDGVTSVRVEWEAP